MSKQYSHNLQSTNQRLIPLHNFPTSTINVKNDDKMLNFWQFFFKETNIKCKGVFNNFYSL